MELLTTELLMTECAKRESGSRPREARWVARTDRQLAPSAKRGERRETRGCWSGHGSTTVSGTSRRLHSVAWGRHMAVLR